MALYNIVGEGEIISEYIISQKTSKDGCKTTQRIDRITEKTFILECGCEHLIHRYGYKRTQKRLNCQNDCCDGESRC